jgi:hypothetical protein
VCSRNRVMERMMECSVEYIQDDPRCWAVVIAA